MDTLNNRNSGDENLVPIWKWVFQYFSQKVYALTSESFPIDELRKYSKDMASGLGSVDFSDGLQDSNIGEHVDIITLRKYFNRQMKTILNTQPIINLLTLNIRLNYIAAIGEYAVMDIFSMLMLHKNTNIPAIDCKKIILSSMQKGLKERSPGVGIKDIIPMYVDEGKIQHPRIIEHIDKVILGDKRDIPLCPLSQIPEGIMLINEIWDALENEFLPALQETYKNKKEFSKKELFYLGRYNELEKET